jgi:DNA modification methylase
VISQADYRETLTAAADAGGADLIATSPPYADARGYGMACSWTDADYAALGDAVFAALKPGGHAIVNIDAPVREWRPGYGTERGFHPWRMMLDWAERIGFRVPDRLAFARLGSPGAYAGRFRNDWEPLLWFQRPGGDGFFDKHSIAAETKYEYARKAANSRRNDGTLNVRFATGWAAENNRVQRGTLWDYGRVGHGATGAPDIEAEGHPARWPYCLAADIIRCFAPPGGLVCDPFVGAGTTAAAAQDLGRRFIGGDLGARTDGTPWADVARRVVESRARQQRMFA